MTELEYGRAARRRKWFVPVLVGSVVTVGWWWCILFVVLIHDNLLKRLITLPPGLLRDGWIPAVYNVLLPPVEAVAEPGSVAGYVGLAASLLLYGLVMGAAAGVTVARVMGHLKKNAVWYWVWFGFALLLQMSYYKQMFSENRLTGGIWIAIVAYPTVSMLASFLFDLGRCGEREYLGVVFWKLCLGAICGMTLWWYWFVVGMSQF